MLGLRGDDVLLAGALAVEPSDAFDCLIIGKKKSYSTKKKILRF